MSSKKPIRLKPSDVQPKVQPAKKTVSYAFSAKTQGQKEYVRTILDNTVTFCTGPAGTGKSYIALGIAAQKFLEGEFDKIIIVRPAVEASKGGLGFLKGSLEEKILPYMLPAIENFCKIMGKERFRKEFELENIKFETLEYLRGRTFDYSIIIGEEFQNCTTEQLIMFVTRIGENSKMIVNGDSNQADLYNDDWEFRTDLDYVINRVQKCNLENFAAVEMTENDIVRNPLIGPFLKAMKK